MTYTAADKALPAFIQGYLAMTCMQPEFPIFTQEVDAPALKSADKNDQGGVTVTVQTNDDGLYQRYFTIVTASGLRVRVTVELEEE